MYNLQEAMFAPLRVKLSRFHLLYPLIFLVCFNVPAWAEPIVRTVYADSVSLVVEFKLPDLRISDENIDGQIYSEVSFNGAQHTLKVGYPKLPTYSQLIGIPIRDVPQATIINSQFETRSTKKILPVQSDSVRQSEDSPIPSTVRYEPHTEFYRENRFYPKQLAEIVPIGFIRDQRVAQLQIHPIQYNPQQSKLKICRELQIRIDFSQSASSDSQVISTYRSSRAFEDLFQSRLLNYDQAKAWRLVRQSQAQLVSAFAQGNTEQRFKLSISQTGMYRIPYSRLERAGADTAHIDLDTIRIENNGRKVGAFVSDEDNNGRFDTGDSIIFYGQKIIGNRFTETNVYWLSWNGVGSSRIGVKDAQLETRGAHTPVAFLKTERFEKDIFHNSLESSDSNLEDADHYFWAGIKAGDNKPFSINTPGAIPRQLINRPATIRVRLQGVSLFTHRARILLNDKWIARTQHWRRQDDLLTINEFQQRQFLVHHTVNTLTVIAEDEPRLSTDEAAFYVDWFELDYWHGFKAVSGALEFNSNIEPEPRGTVRFRVENLRTDEVDVYKIHNGSIDAKLVNGRISRTSSNNFQITFEDVVTQPSSYFALDNRAYLNVTRIVQAKPATLRDPANQADYIVISHKDFIESIQPLVEFRRSQGHSVIVVDIDDVYEQFNHGIFSPFAIQHFLSYAYKSWQQPAPSYVLLVGDAHYDYKEATVEFWRLAKKSFRLPPIYVPTIHGWSPVSGETAMDHRFVTVSGDDTLPDMFIGRLSVQYSRDLDTMVKKLIDYELNPKPGVWQRTLAQVSDDEKSHSIDWIFEESRDRIIKEFIPSGYDTRKIYLRRIESPERTNGLILQAINEGVLILEYAGHGGSETWADEGIFRIENIPRLKNEHHPFVVTTTCLNGQFDRPLRFGARSLSEEFMMGSQGAIGTLSATRLTFATANAAFDEDLFNSIFSVNPSTLGAITAYAKTKFIGNSISNNRLSWIPGAEQYTLFGDPATQLALPDLEIKVELDDSALNSSKQLVVKQNSVGYNGIALGTGRRRFVKATDFSVDRLSAAVLYANSFDEDPYNDLSMRQDHLNVWKGDFGTIRFDVPLDVTAGRGVVRLFASDGKHTAIGGAEFWTKQALFHDVRENLDAEGANALSLHVQIVDDTGQGGIKSVDVVWNDTSEFKTHTTPMVPDPQFSVPVINGGLWWRLQSPIPLPRAGRSVNYQILATDQGDDVVFYPSKTERKTVQVPANANLAIAPSSRGKTSIRYVRLEDDNLPALMADLINDGGNDVPVDVEVWFTNGDPDRNVDYQIDRDARVIGKVVVDTNDWEPGDTAYQKVTAVLTLDAPLSRGHHDIHVFVDPTPSDRAPENSVIGALDEARSADNKGNHSFDVNEFTLQPESDLMCTSLDRVFDAHFTAGSLIPTTLSVDALKAPISSQPDLKVAPIPQPARVQDTLKGQDAGALQAYRIKLPSTDMQLDRPIEVRFRFDYDFYNDPLRVQVRNASNPSEAMKNMGIYTWREQNKTWKRLASTINYQENRNLLKEKFLTPAQNRNRNLYELKNSQIRIDPDRTPIGEWIILFVDSEQYIVRLRQADSSVIEQVGRSGKPGQVFANRNFGIQLELKRVDEVDISRPFEYGDVLTFETRLGRSDRLYVSEFRNSNRGDGRPELNLSIESEDKFRFGDWLIFFRDDQTFEIHERSDLSDGVANEEILLGSVGKTLFIGDPGIEVLITSGAVPFAYGDKFKFSTRTVGTISAEVSELVPFALMANSDTSAPMLKLWVDGKPLNSGSVVSSRPQISVILEDLNGIDMDAFRFAVSKNGGPIKEITEFTITNPEEVTPVTIVYTPVLSVGRYLYRLWAKDLNGNELGYDGGYSEFILLVSDPPDIEPPEVEIRINQEILTDGMILRQQPKIEIGLVDDYGLDFSTIQFSFGKSDDDFDSVPHKAYDLAFDETQPEVGSILYSPSLVNGEYQIQIYASDTSGNTHEGDLFRFQLDEAVEINEVWNVPNPIRTGTFFTYNFVQSPEHVTIKIYSIAGRLVRTIVDASARRGYNETYWDGRDEDGNRLSNGTYFYKVTVESENREIERVGRLAILR